MALIWIRKGWRQIERKICLYTNSYSTNTSSADLQLGLIFFEYFMLKATKHQESLLFCGIFIKIVDVTHCQWFLIRLQLFFRLFNFGFFNRFSSDFESIKLVVYRNILSCVDFTQSQSDIDQNEVKCTSVMLFKFEIQMVLVVCVVALIQVL